MQALKALVIFMAILIAIGVTVVGITIYRRATTMVATEKTEPTSVARGSVTGEAGAMPRFGVRPLDLPAGSEIVSVQALEQGVLVHARVPGGATRLLVLDPASGEVRGEWRTDAAQGTPGAGSGSAP